MKKLWLVPLIAAGVVAPAVVQAPRSVQAFPEGVRTLDDAVAVCRASGNSGWELVEYAQRLVHAKFTRHSILNLWETPDQAFSRGRGYCNQYNTALGKILRELGIQVERVFATQVRLDDNPWWRMGHTWLRVTVDGRTLDVCAGKPGHRPGQVEFVALTEVRPFRTLTYWNTNTAMMAFTLYHEWKSMLLQRPLPRWMYRPFGEPVAEAD